MKKVLFLSPRFYPEIGGVEKHVLEISKELVKKGFEVSVITELNSNYQSKSSSDKGMQGVKQPSISGKSEVEEIEGIDVYRLSFGKSGKLKKFRIWKTIWENRQLIRNVDVIHCHDVFVWYLPFRFLYPRKKVFTTFHGWEGICPPKRSAKLIRKLSEKLSAGNICVGRYIEKWYGTRANIVTYGGVNQSQISKFKSQNNNSKLKICFVGRIAGDNGIEMYVEILELIQDKNIKFEFEAVGDGELRKQFEKFGKVYGFVEDPKLFIKKADIIFASSYLSILESLVLGKLVVSVYDNPLKKDYLEMTPFRESIVITDNPKIAVEKIVENKSNRTEFEWVRKQTWEYLSNQYIQLWKSK